MLTWIKIRRDLWPSTQEVDAALTATSRPDFYCEAYGGDTELLYSRQVLGSKGGGEGRTSIAELKQLIGFRRDRPTTAVFLL